MHEGLAAMAGAYLFHIARNHPLIDGNKRTAAAAAIAFLYINGVALDVDEKEFGDLVLAVASGTVEKDGAIAFFKRHVSEDAS